MEPKIFNVLFLCTGNSARSILAEAILNHVCSHGRFRAFSAGSHPSGQPNPYAIQLLTAQRIPVEGLRSKSWDEFARPDSPRPDFVITVCDQAAGEQCPLWPGHTISAHWGMPDPARVEGSEEAKCKAFADTLLILRRRIELFTCLPLASLDRMALQRHIRQIGNE